MKCRYCGRVSTKSEWVYTNPKRKGILNSCVHCDGFRIKGLSDADKSNKMQPHYAKVKKHRKDKPKKQRSNNTPWWVWIMAFGLTLWVVAPEILKILLIICAVIAVITVYWKREVISSWLDNKFKR